MKQLSLPLPIPDGMKLIFRPWIVRNGQKIYAKQYGLKAFPLLVKA